MSAAEATAGAAPGFDIPALEALLRRLLPEAEGRAALAPISGGQSNPTFFLDAGAARLVLRKQPPGELLPSAHAIDREYRVLEALRGTGVPVPEVIHYCEDRSIAGTPFYLMRRVDGRVMHDGRLAAAPAGERRAMYRSLADALARLHAVDPLAAGLEGFGRQGGYFARQIARWSRQWQLSRRREDENIDRLIEWLPGAIPEDGLTAISHGDYRMGNVMFAPAGPEIVAILDWELSTLGHPLADLAHCCMAWHIRPEEYGGVLGVDLDAEALPSQAEFEAWYAESSGRPLRLEPFHMAFALFRFAVVFEGIAARAAAGNAAAADAGKVGPLAAVFAARAAAIAGLA